MGLLDVKIEIARNPRWGSRNQRIGRLKSKPTPSLSNQPSDPSSSSSTSHSATNGEIHPTDSSLQSQQANTGKHMALELYWAATKDDVEGLISILERISEEKGLALSEILEQVSPLGNTLLHVAASHGNVANVMLIVYHYPSIFMKQNREGDTALHLAARAGHRHVTGTLLGSGENWVFHVGRYEGTSIMRAMPDEDGQTPLHYAASKGYVDMVQYILDKDVTCALERDKSGFFPIHMAAAHGHTQVIHKLLQCCPDPREMLSYSGQNLLHTAAARGKQNVVCLILQTPALESLINEGDYKGDTPLHLATMNWHPKIVSAMTWDKRVNMGAVNSEGLTALDAAEFYMENSASFSKRLTWTALKAAGAPQAPRNEILKFYQRTSSQQQPSNTDNYKDRVNTLLLVATLVATVTFAAGFTMPGGYNESDPYQGMATLIQKKAFYVFVFSDTIAMYSSILVATSLIWAQLGDLKLVHTALRIAIPLLGVALTMMSLAFMAGVYLVVSKLNWLAYAVLFMDSTCLFALILLFFPLCFPISSENGFLRYLSYYPLHLLIQVTDCKDEVAA